ncbi:MAG: sugar phosphate nucleotidyltransferase [Nanoarchaeota archaeon]|nr:sugar phosphate nucleotidyltransferase [Nanoarchaeota archaeon]
MGKTRVSIYIDEEVISRVDKEIDNSIIKSRSEAIEFIIKRHLSEKKTCVILAGGPSENLLIKGKDIYRPLVEIKGKTLIKHSIEQAKAGGYNYILIIGSKKVLSAIYSNLGDGKDMQVEIEYLEEKEHLGSGKTLALAKDKIKSTFLFLPSDHYFEKLDIKKIEEYHKLNKGVATLVVYSGTTNEWAKSSIVDLEGNKIKIYEEKPKNVKTHLTALMTGIAEPEIFDYIPSGKINWSLQENIFTELAKKELLIGYIFSGKWKNIHDKHDLVNLK